MLNTYLSVKKAFSVSPAQAVATASTKVTTPNVEWMGTKLARKDAVADSQQSSNRKLKKPTTNCKEQENMGMFLSSDFEQLMLGREIIRSHWEGHG